MKNEFIETPMRLAESYDDRVTSRQEKCSLRKGRMIVFPQRRSSREMRHFEHEKRKLLVFKARKVSAQTKRSPTDIIDEYERSEDEDPWKVWWGGWNYDGYDSYYDEWLERHTPRPIGYPRMRDPSVSYASVAKDSRAISFNTDFDSDIGVENDFYSLWKPEDFPVCSA
jgi:hypothetical protein